jgi:biotin synthase
LLDYSNEAVEFRTFLPPLPDLTTNGAAQSALHERAAATTRQHFGRSVFVRAVVELSNFCREQCTYCGMRRNNEGLKRYRAQVEQLAEVIFHHRPAFVTDINLQAGEDPVAVREVALPLIRLLRRETNLGISVCLGTLSRALYQEMQEAGASIYIIKFECADPAKYAEYQAPGTLAERVDHIQLLAAKGWAVSSGFIVGLPGQDPAALLQNLELAASLPLRGCSVSPFIAGESTPLAGCSPANANWTLNCMAALRLLQPGWVIPAVSALNLAEQDGYRRGLRAGANLVTVNITPDQLRGDYVIYKRDRFIMSEERVLAALEAEGLAPSSLGLAEFYRNNVRRPAALNPAPVN